MYMWCVLLALGLLALLVLAIPMTMDGPRTATICAIAKWEERYIDEWIQHHLDLGFDRIYVYDNSDANTLRHLPQRYGGKVHVTHWPGPVRQYEAYNDFVSKRRFTPMWTAFLDVDEFIVLKTHPNIKAFLWEHCHRGAVSLNWMLFGSSGQTRYRPEMVRRRFLRRGERPDHHVKSIAYMPDVLAVDNAHSPVLVGGARQRDTAGHEFTGPFHADGPVDVAVVHHYFCKSKEEYEVKHRRAMDAGWGSKSFAIHDQNDVFDDSALGQGAK